MPGEVLKSRFTHWTQPPARKLHLQAPRLLSRSRKLAKMRRAMFIWPSQTGGRTRGAITRPIQDDRPLHRMIVNCNCGDETISQSGRSQPEARVCSSDHDQTTGFDHGGVHHQPVLQAILQGRAISHATGEPQLTEIRAASAVTIETLVRGRTKWMIAVAMT
jgi:hypothetical protein